MLPKLHEHSLFLIGLIILLSAAQLTEAKHYTCSWQPFHPTPSVTPTQAGWNLYCHARWSAATHQYQCQFEKSSEIYPIVADWGFLAPNVLESGASFWKAPSSGLNTCL